MTTKLELLALPALMACAFQVHAQSATTQMPEGSTDIEISAIAALVPVSEGKVGSRLVVLPAASVRWSNGVFLAPGELGMQVSEDPTLKYGPLLTYGTRSRRADDPDDKVRLGVEAGAFASYQFAHNIAFGSQLLYGGGDDRRGLRMSLGANYSMWLGAHQSVSLGLGTTLANGAYLQSYFGITPQQAARTGRPAYDADAGVKDVRASINWNVQVSNKFSLTTGVQASRLTGSAAQSPLVSKTTSTLLYTRLSYHY